MNISNGAETVLLGSLGWSHPAWRDAFYPADMPEEWQLTFFNTQFHCVFLRREDWQQVSASERSQWHADTHDLFRFLLEEDDTQPVPEELAGKAVVLSPDASEILWFTRDSSLKELAASLSGSAGPKPRYMISRDADLGQMERVATLLEVMGLGS
jgi:hypothetical protein